jgi:hypothetical protein
MYVTKYLYIDPVYIMYLPQSNTIFQISKMESFITVDVHNHEGALLPPPPILYIVYTHNTNIVWFYT